MPAIQWEYERACEEVQGYSPSAVVLRHEGVAFEALYEIIAIVAPRHDSEIEFLCAVAPIIRERKSGKALAHARDFVLNRAEELRFKVSFTLIAALSCFPKERAP